MDKIFKMKDLIISTPRNYALGYINNFMDNRFYESVSKEVLKFSETAFDPSFDNYWMGLEHGDPTLAKNNYKLLGGGYDGDTIEKFKLIIDKFGLRYLSKLLMAFDTQQFADYIYSKLDLKKLNIKPFKVVDSDYSLGLSGSNYQHIYTSFKLSCYPPSSGIAFHRDNQKKLVGMLLYFGFSDKKIRKKGGTQFASDENTDSGWSEKQENHSFHFNKRLNIVHNHYPYPNSFAAFLINNHSWHKVDPFEGDSKLFRINLQINFMRINKKSLLHKIKNRIIR